MKEFVEKLIERLDKQAEKYRQRGFEHEQKGYSVMADKYYGKQCSYLYSIEIVNELAEEYIPCTKSCADCEAYDLVKHNCPKFCKVIKETVEEVKENYNNGWIACSERLPEEYDKYLCCNKYGEYIIGYPIARVSSDDFYVETENEIMNDCIAWRPLPESYKEVGVE